MTATMTRAIDFVEPATGAATTASVVEPGRAPAHWLAGGRLETLVTGAQTRGVFDVTLSRIPPGGGPPPHIHRREDELFYVVTGEFEFVFGEQSLRAGSGACLFLPRNVVHQFKNVGHTTGTLLNASMPTGFADFVADAGSLVID